MFSNLKHIENWYLLIGCAYSTLRCLKLKIWQFSCQQQQTITLPLAHALRVKGICYWIETKMGPGMLNLTNSVSWQLNRIAILHEKLPIGLSDKSRKETVVHSKLGSKVKEKEQPERSGKVRDEIWFLPLNVRGMTSVFAFTDFCSDQKMYERQDEVVFFKKPWDVSRLELWQDISFDYTT